VKLGFNIYFVVALLWATMSDLVEVGALSVNILLNVAVKNVQ
jgi:hypothetical protein